MPSQGSHRSPLVLYGTRCWRQPPHQEPTELPGSSSLACPRSGRVPAHPLSSMRRVKRPPTGPYQSYSASRLTSPRSQLSGRCVQLLTDSRQGEQVLGGTGAMQTHPPGTLFISKPTGNSHHQLIKREPYLFCHPSISGRQSLIYRKVLTIINLSR